VANYPAFPQRLGSVRETLDDLRLERAIDGTGYGRALFAATKSRFTVLHVLTYANLATLEAFYQAQRNVQFDIVWQGEGDVTYTGLLFEEPVRKTELGAGWVAVESRIAQK